MNWNKPFSGLTIKGMDKYISNRLEEKVCGQDSQGPGLCLFSCFFQVQKLMQFNGGAFTRTAADKIITPIHPW